MERFTQFLVAVKGADLSDKRVFSSLVKEGLALTGMSVREAGQVFRTAPGTVSRWENGHTAPPLVARKVIVDMLAARVSRIKATLAPLEMAAVG